MSWEHPYDVIRGGNSLSYSNELWYWQQYQFIYLISPYSETFFLFPYMHQFSYWLDK